MTARTRHDARQARLTIAGDRTTTTTMTTMAMMTTTATTRGDARHPVAAAFTANRRSRTRQPRRHADAPSRRSTHATAKDAGGAASARETCVLRGALHRGDERMEWSTALLILSGGHLVTPTHVARFTHRGDLGWIAFLAREGQLVIPCDDLDALFAEMTKRPGAPLLDISPDSRRPHGEVAAAPPALRAHRAGQRRTAAAGRCGARGAGCGASAIRRAPLRDRLDSRGREPLESRRWRRPDADDLAMHDSPIRASATPLTPGDDAASDDTGLERARHRFRADQRLTASRDTLHADVTFEYAYGARASRRRGRAAAPRRHGESQERHERRRGADCIDRGATPTSRTAS